MSSTPIHAGPLVPYVWSVNSEWRQITRRIPNTSRNNLSSPWHMIATGGPCISPITVAYCGFSCTMRQGLEGIGVCKSGPRSTFGAGNAYVCDRGTTPSETVYADDPALAADRWRQLGAEQFAFGRFGRGS